MLTAIFITVSSLTLGCKFTVSCLKLDFVYIHICYDMWIIEVTELSAFD